MNDHTPGPWRILHHDDGSVHEGSDASLCVVGKVIPEENGDWMDVILVADIHPTPGRNRRDANAALIAAAPELLQALQTLASKYNAKMIVSAWEPGTERHDVWHQALAAINKANP